MSEVNLNNLAVIEGHPTYRINTDGHVYDAITGDYVEPISDLSVEIDGELRSIDTLLAETYIGRGEYDVVPGRSAINSSRQQRLTYLVTTFEPLNENGTYLMNDIIEFYPIPIKDEERYYISMDGVIYDKVKKDFVHRCWKNGRIMAILYGESMLVAACMFRTFIDEIPDGMYIKFIDGNMYNINLSNLTLQTLAEIRRAAKNQRGNTRDVDTMRKVCEIIASCISDDCIINRNNEIAKILDLPYESRTDKHRIASLVNKLRYRTGYYDDLKKEFGFVK